MTNGKSPAVGPLLGRLLISQIFILSGLMKIVHFQPTVEAIRGAGLIIVPTLLAVIALLCELIGGVLILLGWKTRIGVAILMIFLFPTTLAFHNFWHYEGQEQMVQMANFLKNITIYGGLLLLWSYGPGRWSFDSCSCCKKE